VIYYDQVSYFLGLENKRSGSVTLHGSEPGVDFDEQAGGVADHQQGRADEDPEEDASTGAGRGDR